MRLAAATLLVLVGLSGCMTTTPELELAFVNGSDETHEVQHRLIRIGGSQAQTITETVTLEARQSHDWTYLDWPDERRTLRVFVDGVKVYDRVFEEWIKRVDLCLAMDAEGAVTEHTTPCPDALSL